MRVLVVTGLYPPEGGGPATHTKMMEKYLPAYGLTVDVLPFRRVRHLPPVIRHAALLVLCVLRARHADVVFAQDTASVGFPARLASWLVGARFVVRVPGDHVWEQGRARFGVQSSLEDFALWPTHPYLFFLRLVQRCTLTGAHVVVPSDFLLGIVLRWGVARHRVVRLYNGVDLSAPVDMPEEPVARPCILSIARLVAWKGLRELISTLPGHLSWHLYLVGDGPQRHALVVYAQEIGVYERVHFLGEQSNARARGWMEAADVCVLNSTYEGFSHVLVEMLHAGKPIVATDLPGNREAAGQCARYVEPGSNTQELVRAIDDMLVHKEVDQEARACSKQRAEQFSVSVTSRALAEYLKTVCA